MADVLDHTLRLYEANSSASFGQFTLSSSTSACEWIFRAREAITITRVAVRQGTVTGTAPTYRVSLQGVDASGLPDGTIKNGGTAYVDITPTSGGNSTLAWHTLGASYTSTRGEVLAIVVKYQSGTIDASNNCSFTLTSSYGLGVGSVYAIQNSSGTRTLQTNHPLFGYGSSTTAYGAPITAINTSAFASSSNPDERALKFTLPTSVYASAKLAGFSMGCSFATGGSVDVVLYDGTTSIASVTIDTDQDGGNTSFRTRTYYFTDTTLPTLTAGTVYRLSFKPTTGSHTILVATTSTAADLDAFPMGQDFCYSYRTDAGSWTDDATSRPSFASLIFDDVTPASSGGLAANPLGGFVR